MDSAISTILITIVILATIFLILREVMCWYWKINERISLMEENNKLLKTLLSKNHLNINEGISTAINEETSNNTLETILEPKSDAKSITVRHKVSKRQETVSLDMWEKMKKMYGEENYVIISWNT